jgi:hypothetical protein
MAKRIIKRLFNETETNEAAINQLELLITQDDEIDRLVNGAWSGSAFKIVE